MARKRDLSPGFFENPTLSKLPLTTQFMYQGTWIHSDYNGVFLWDPERLAMQTLPRQDFDAVVAMSELEGAGKVRRFTSGGKHYGYIPTWTKHQNPNHKERPAHPKPDDPSFVIRVKPAPARIPGDNCYGEEGIRGGCFSQAEITQMRVKCNESVSRPEADLRPALRQPYGSTANQLEIRAEPTKKNPCQEKAEGEGANPEQLPLAKGTKGEASTLHEKAQSLLAKAQKFRRAS